MGIKLRKTMRLRMSVSFLVVLSLINVYTIAPSASTLSKANRSESSADSTSKAEDKMSVTYGVDSDGVPFALSQDGAKAKYLSVSPKQFKMQIFKGSYLGEVLFRRTPDHGVTASFNASNKESLTAQAALLTAVNQPQEQRINLSLQYTKGGKSLKTALKLEERDGAQGKMEELQKIINEVRASESLTKLLATARIFGNLEYVKRAYGPAVDETGCFGAATSCLVAVVEYGLGVALIAEVCGVTIGAGCVGLLLFHPAASAVVALHCADAINLCNLDPGDHGGGSGGPDKQPYRP